MNNITTKMFFKVKIDNMETLKYLIIGGVAGGATAAARLRRIDENAEIILFEKGKHISFANCGLPYYIGNTIEQREALFLQTPTSFGDRFNVDVRNNQEVISIDPNKKSVQVKRANRKIYEETYDKLLLSPGANPFIPKIEGVDSEGIFTLRNVEDTDNIKNYAITHKIKQAVVIGAGFIGLEMVENLHHLGIDVSIVEMANQLMPTLDYEMAAFLKMEMVSQHVKMHLGTSATRFYRENEKLQIVLSNGETLSADMVILSVGVRPNTALAQSAGIKLGVTGGIWVDEYLQTSVPDIYAVGDAIEYPHPITRKPWLNFLANPANRQGRIVADNIVWGNKVRYEGAIGTAIAKVFNMTAASTGLSEKKLQQEQIPYLTSTTHSNSHAGYYPNAQMMAIKLTFSPENGKILGAQIVGYDGVDKRIDQIALLIKNGGSIYDLTLVEHAYAPPFSSAKDPVAIAGYVACNVYNGIMPTITWRDLDEQKLPEGTLIDVRTLQEFTEGAIPNAIHIPVDELRERLDEIPEDKPIYLYCGVGLRGYVALKILTQSGFKNVYNLSGGYRTYATAII